jgi:hypothetical protein
LYDAGFLKQRREGLWAYYSIDKPSLDGCLAALLNAIEIGLKDSSSPLRDIESLKKAKRLGPQCCQKC